MRNALLLSLLIFSGCLFASENSTILFIRGGSRTGGFLEGGADEQLSDINDYSTNEKNHGWGSFADVLRAEGFELEQKKEGAKTNNTPVDLINTNLSDYKVIVFGSNNAAYSQRAVDSLWAYVKRGGGALFISDANWGTNWGDAPSSDQSFLSSIGWGMNQDQGTYPLYSSNFKDKNHLILKGVNSFDGEGVSPISLLNNAIPGVTSTILAPAKNSVRRNTKMTKGPSESPTSKDASLIVAQVGFGRVAGHFDRNTFFNANGAGSNIHKNSNKQYARNLFNWLAGTDLVNTAIAPNVLKANIYPNPANNSFEISNVSSQSKIFVYDLQGKEISYKKSLISVNGIKVIPLVNRRCVLLVRVVDGSTSQIQKVLFIP